MRASSQMSPSRARLSPSERRSNAAVATIMTATIIHTAAHTNLTDAIESAHLRQMRMTAARICTSKHRSISLLRIIALSYAYARIESIQIDSAPSRSVALHCHMMHACAIA
jgi:hypothetical protein